MKHAHRTPLFFFILISVILTSLLVNTTHCETTIVHNGDLWSFESTYLTSLYPHSGAYAFNITNFGSINVTFGTYRSDFTAFSAWIRWTDDSIFYVHITYANGTEISDSFHPSSTYYQYNFLPLFGNVSGVIKGFGFNVTGGRCNIDDIIIGAPEGSFSNGGESPDFMPIYQGGGGTPPPSGEDGYDSWYSTTIISFMVLFIFILVPPLILAVELRDRVNPSVSLIIGLVFTTGIGFSSGLVPLWFVFMIVIAITIIFLELLHGRGRI